jgi:hypothetical protein
MWKKRKDEVEIRAAPSALIAEVLTLWLEHSLAYRSEAKGCGG